MEKKKLSKVYHVLKRLLLLLLFFKELSIYLHVAISVHKYILQWNVLNRFYDCFFSSHSGSVVMSHLKFDQHFKLYSLYVYHESYLNVLHLIWLINFDWHTVTLFSLLQKKRLSREPYLYAKRGQWNQVPETMLLKASVDSTADTPHVLPLHKPPGLNKDADDIA